MDGREREREAEREKMAEKGKEEEKAEKGDSWKIRKSFFLYFTAQHIES